MHKGTTRETHDDDDEEGAFGLESRERARPMASLYTTHVYTRARTRTRSKAIAQQAEQPFATHRCHFSSFQIGRSRPLRDTTVV